MNALRHGLRGAQPVIPEVEHAADWDAHRAGVLDALAPVGALEQALAARVALQLWRLDRVARYETAMIALGQEAVPEDVRNASDLGELRAVADILGHSPEMLLRVYAHALPESVRSVADAIGRRTAGTKGG